MQKVLPRQYSLRSLLIGLTVTLSFATAVALGFLVERAATQYLEERIGEQLSQRMKTLANQLDRSMYERYHDIRLQVDSFVRFDVLDDPQTIRSQLDTLSTENEGYAWIGYTNRHGRVIAANRGLLEGEDVSQRPWFVEGKKAAFVGDLHRAVLLEKKLNVDGDGPLRFLDIAMPVVDRNGTFTGVVGAHINWRWIRNITMSLPKREHSEVLIVSADNTVLLGPGDLQDTSLLLGSVQQAEKGLFGYRIEQWPDGKTYLTGYAKSEGYKDYPGLGWLILERQEVSHAFSAIKELRHQFILWSSVIAVLFALLGWLIAAKIARPLTAITQAAALLKRGQRQVKIPIMKGYREVTVLSRTLSKLVTELTEREAQLEHQATHQSLTQLPNRALMKALIDQSLSLPSQQSRQIAILALDLDRFQKINDTKGYDAGNRVILAVVERLQACIGTASTVGHFGKDEFVLMVEEHDVTLSYTAALASRIHAAMAKPFIVHDVEFFLSASIGISVFPKDGADAEILLTCSGAALRQAKAKGGNCIEFYEPQMNASVMKRLGLERDLRQALERQEFELHYQPQVSLKSGAIEGVEALLRWRHPERGMVSPAEFIPVAEVSGLIVPIGDWVLNKACAQAQTWREEGLPPLRMGVNVSSHQFSKGHIIQKVATALSQSGLEPTGLKLEITESLLMQEVEHNITTMKQLADLGVHLAIDDFGTGYSSLSYLKRFPVSELKIDQSFIRELASESDDAAIVDAIISLGHSLNLTVIAEGVETKEQREYLQQAGCDEMQGYYFSRPLPADKLSALLREYIGTEKHHG
jgi:diguanylate cyclase (GGDEF)-like protein